MMKLIVKNVKAGSLGKLTACIVKTLNNSQLRFLTGYLPSMIQLKHFLSRLTFEICEKNVHKIDENFIFGD